MKIAVNTRMLIPEKMEGIGRFTYEIMKRVTTQHPEHQFYFIFDRRHDEQFIFSKNITPISISPPARHPVLWYLWHEWSLTRLLDKIKPDLFVATDGYLSTKSKVPSLAIIHDLNFEHFPEDMPFFNKIYYRHYFPIYTRTAKRIAAVSEFTKKDLQETYQINPDKIDIVYNAASDGFKTLNESEKEIFRNKYSDGKPYFLFVGALHQRKNIANLLRAFDGFKKTVSSPIKIVLAGQKRWWTKEMEEVHSKMTFRDDVVFTGRVSQEELEKITASAFAATYVSAFEGFGIPIIEAMKCGVPVIMSNVTSMPEVAGDASLLCDPFSVGSISDAMLKIYSDEGLRKLLIEKGIKRQEFFSWEKSADALWSSIEKTIGLNL